MKKLIITAALASVIASPALAQSYDPSVGSGNIAPRVLAGSTQQAPQLKLNNSFGSYAQVPHATRINHSFTRQRRR